MRISYLYIQYGLVGRGGSAFSVSPITYKSWLAGSAIACSAFLLYCRTNTTLDSVLHSYHNVEPTLMLIQNVNPFMDGEQVDSHILFQVGATCRVQNFAPE